MFPTLATARGALETLARDCEPGTLSGEQALRAAAELGTIRKLCDGLLARVAKRVEDTAAHYRTGDRNAAAAVARAVGVDAAEARRAIDTAEKLEALPAVDTAVREGRLTARQAEMIVGAATVNPAAEQQLLDAATQGLTPLRDACVEARARAEGPAARARRHHAARSLRTWTDHDGMLAGHFRLTPEVGGQVKAVIDAAVQRTFRERRRAGDREPHEAYAADALAACVLEHTTSAAGRSEPGPRTRRVQAQVHIFLDHAALTRGDVLPGERCEIPGVGPVNLEWVRGLLGEAFLTAIIRKGRDITTVTHLGRHIPAELRTGLIAGGRECDIEGCHHRGYLEIDHEVPYARGGPTSFENLGWRCAIHHRLKSRGWILGPPDPITGKRTLRPPPGRTNAA